MSFKILYGNDNCLRSDLKLSGAQLCTAGRAFKLTGLDGEITPVSSKSDAPAGLFAKTVTATVTTHLGKNGEVGTIHDGAVVETSDYNTGSEPAPADHVCFGATGQPEAQTGAGTYGIGICDYSDGTVIRFRVNTSLLSAY